MPDEKLRTHERAIQVVLEELAKRRFVMLAHRGKINESIIVTGREGRLFHREVEVHGDQTPNSRKFFRTRPTPPPENPDHFVALVSLMHYYVPQFYVLTNAEARVRYESNTSGGSDYLIDDLRPDPDRFDLIDPATAGTP